MGKVKSISLKLITFQIFVYFIHKTLGGYYESTYYIYKLMIKRAKNRAITEYT
jgi:hypothetical protein